jgi:O-antigen/teichoic acid export membrane protein
MSPRHRKPRPVSRGSGPRVAALPELVRRLRAHKLSRDITYSLGSFGVLAVSGIAINIAVTHLRDAAALGVFNLAYAAYIVASQFAVWGIHYSVLRAAAYHRESQGELGRMLMTAMTLALALGAAGAAALSLLGPLLARTYTEQGSAAIRHAAAGLLLFPLNKVLLAHLNGLRMMRAFALLQAMRYLLVMAGVIAVAASSAPIEDATFVFLFAEGATSGAALAVLWASGQLRGLSFCRAWAGRHLRFGSKAMLSGMFAEVNSRLDVLMVGLFCSDSATGVYSFASMMVDGLYHVLAMIRINFNPMLVTAVRDHDWSKVRSLRSMSCRVIVPAIAGASLLIAVAFLAIALWIVPGKGLLGGFPSLLILLAGLNAVSALVPFDNLMLVSGHPAYQTLQQITAVVANIVVALLLLPWLGIAGAALGTVANYLAGIAMLIVLARRLLGWAMLRNTRGVEGRTPSSQDA